MAAELARENAQALQSRLGRSPSAGELYAAHVMGSGGALRLIEAAAQRAPNAAALFPREAAANRGLFYVNGAPRSAQSLLDRLNVDASASVSASTPRSVEPVRSGEGMSPALAQALFAFALLPLLRDSNAESHDLFEALTAYERRAKE